MLNIKRNKQLFVFSILEVVCVQNNFNRCDHIPSPFSMELTALQLLMAGLRRATCYDTWDMVAEQGDEQKKKLQGLAVREK